MPGTVSRRAKKKKEKRYHKGTKRTGDPQFLDQHILKDKKTRRKNVVMAWIEYKKKSQWYNPANLDSKLSENVQDIQQSHKIHHGSHEKLECRIDSRRKNFSRDEKIQRGIFQEDVLSLLLFVIAMIPLNSILRKCTGDYKFTKLREMINHLMYKDDINL